jgi:Ca-activated chloride channel family protein
VTLVRPEVLVLAAVGAAILALAVVAQWRRLRRLQERLGGAALARLLPAGALRFPLGRVLCMVVAAVALGLAAAEPRTGPSEPAPPAAPLDLAIAVDVSLSMGSADAAPSRIARARQVVAQLAQTLPAARILLVVFADWPYTLVPATDDPAVVQYFAEALQTNLVLDRDQGTALSAAIDHATAALAARPRAGARRVLVLVSDGGTHDDPEAVVASARAAREAGVEVWTAGLGSVRGTELESETGPVLDASGTPVVTRLEERLLTDVATAGGGTYAQVSEDRALRALVARLQDTRPTPAGERPSPPDAALLLALLALTTMLAEGALDGARGRRRAARTGEAW